MNTTALSEEDIHPYRGQKTAVRIFKNNMWFVGILHTIRLTPECTLRVAPMVKFSPHKPDLDPIDLGETLVDPADEAVPSSFSSAWLPFKALANPEKVTSEVIGDAVLMITFDGGAAILSSRPRDIEAVESLFPRAEPRT